MVILPQSKTVNESNPVLLRCEASGYPVPTITWTKDGRQFQAAQRTVKIGQSRKSDAGRYVCTADNGVGQPKTAEAYVTVRCKYRHVINWQNEIETVTTRNRPWLSVFARIFLYTLYYFLEIQLMVQIWKINYI